MGINVCRETYPRLLAEQWVSHLTQRGIETSAESSEPVVWLKSVPAFSTGGVDDSEGDDDARSKPSSSSSEDGESPDELDSDGNVWRGMRHVRSARNGESDETVSPPLSSLDKGTSVANLTIGQVTYLAPVPDGTNPLLPLAFLHHLHAVLLQYFPDAGAASASTSSAAAASIPAPNTPTPIPASTLASNFDLLYQVLQEMLDEGRPLTMDYNSLKGIVRGKAWWEEILSRMSQFTSSAPAPPPQISPLPWRPSGVRYSRNEVYVDIVETLTGVMDRKGKAVSFGSAGGLDLHVSIACRARLSGDPDLTLTLHPSPAGPSSAIGFPTLHPCVRHRRWVKDGVLSFVPPDGEFELAHWPMQRGSGGGDFSSKLNAAAGGDKGVPFTLQATRDSGTSGGKEWTFELRITARKASGNSATSAEGIELSFLVDPTAAAATTTTSNATLNVDARTAVSSRTSSSGFGNTVSASHATSSGTATTSTDEPGTWRFDAREGTLRWSIPRLGSAIGGPSEVVLKGTVSGGNAPSPSSILTKYSLPTGIPSLSGLKVASLQVHGVEYKPFKGVRGATRGQIEWRW